MASEISKTSVQQQWREHFFQIYLVVISALGFLLLIWGSAQIPQYAPSVNFALLVLLGIAAQITNTLVYGIQFSVGTAVALATVPLYGPVAAAFVAAMAEIAGGVLNLVVERLPWRQIGHRISFNVGMNAVAIWLAGSLFTGVVTWLGNDSYLAVTLWWFVAAIVNDQVNLWLLMIVIHLQQGVSIRDIWKENRWASPINILVTAIGGGVLAVAVIQFDLLGMAIFFLPIAVSAYAFRAYVNENEKQKARLEEMVLERTAELAAANKALENLHKEKDAFLAVLTHDMRAPLQSTLGFASLMQMRPDLPAEKQRHMLDVIIRNQETLADMVSNILDIEKLQSGNEIELDQSDMDLAVIVSEVCETMLGTAMQKGIKLMVNLPEHPLYIRGDAGKMKRVITNLVSNAVKYTPEGGQATVTGKLAAEEVLLSIADTGYGISVEALPTIFEPFRRVREHQTVAVGTGLGLAIVKSLVEAHGGSIEVESEVNVGSTFTVRMPAHFPDEPSASDDAFWPVRAEDPLQV